MEAHRDDLGEGTNPKGSLVLTGDQYPSKVAVVYTGKSRPTSDVRKQFLRAWQKSFRDAIPADFPDKFKTEVLFREEKLEIWVPVQEPLVEPLHLDVKPGEEIKIYVIWLGAVREKGSDEWQWLFAVNRFDTAEDERNDAAPKD